MNPEKLGEELANPVLEYYRDDCYDNLPHYHLEGGLTKRELFAAMAMQGYCSGKFGEISNYTEIADMAVKQANALIVELENNA